MHSRPQHKLVAFPSTSSRTSISSFDEKACINLSLVLTGAMDDFLPINCVAPFLLISLLAHCAQGNIFTSNCR
jgi:hypothetical protein